VRRILLLLDNKANRQLLSDWLKQYYEVVYPEEASPLSIPFDLCLIDGPMLDRLDEAIRLRKAEEGSAFLPVILISSHRETELLTRHLWKTIDELIQAPIEKLELRARVEMLLRTRHLSLDLRARNEDLESFFYAMTHDVRAPLRAIKGFSQYLQEESERLSPQGQHDLAQIQAVAEQMQEIIDGVIEFARVERDGRAMQPVALDDVLERCLQRLQSEIQRCHASVICRETLPVVRGNVLLLTAALTNLLTNALKFVQPGVAPMITLRAVKSHFVCRLEIEDNGIGIALEDQKRLFRPFVQLHGVDVYEGVGLGLATVRKAVELMGGRVGIISQPGQGSLFWLELRVAE